MKSLALLGVCAAILGGSAAHVSAASQGSSEFAIIHYRDVVDSRVQLGVIFVDTEAEAEALHARLTQGESFSALAETYSTHPTKAAGGDVGELELGDLREEFRTALTGLGPGSYTDVIALPKGPRWTSTTPRP